jgi:predicted DNA-binding transcriptional regulator AlpA
LSPLNFAPKQYIEQHSFDFSYPELEMARNWDLVEQLSKLEDDVLIGVEEAAALTGFAETTIQQRRIKDFPAPMPGLRRLRWQLGQIRAWGRPAPTSDLRRSAKGK